MSIRRFNNPLRVTPLRASPFRATFFLLACVVGTSACSSDIFDVDVAFTAQSYAFDFGAQTGQVPVVACNADDDPCSGVVTATGDEAIRALHVGCSPQEGQCYVQADAELAFTLSILEQSDFNTKVQRRSIEVVRSVEVAYAIPVNTLSFDIPQIDIFVGPEGTRRFDDPGVVVADHSAARALLQDTIVQRQPFVFVLATSPRLTSGQPIPAGQLTVELHPLVRLGIPR
jgi:hypothetical protein